MIEAERIPHALLLAGPYGVGKGETALELARMLLCENGPKSGCSTCGTCLRSTRIEHPDLYVLFPFRAEPEKADKRDEWLDELLNLRKNIAESYKPVVYEKGKQIVIGLAREVHEKLRESSFEGGSKVCVIFCADRMNAQTANSLLKILEEPPPGVYFILTTERLSSVLPTITSRASVVRFRRLKEEEIAMYLEKTSGIEMEMSISYASLAEGSLKTAKAFAFDSKADVLSQAFELYRTVALGGQDEVVRRFFPFMWSRDVVEVEELIEGFALYTRFVLEKKYGIAHHDGDYSESVAQLSDTADLHALQKLSVKLEEGLEMLGRNVNVSTVITSIFYGINDTYGH
ncbi:hypothetical protein ES707_18019 [subsurface metagenome]